MEIFFSIKESKNQPPTKLDGIIDIPNESSSSDSTVPELMLKEYPRT